MPKPCPLPTAELEALASRYGTPFQLYDGDQIRENVQSLLSSFQAEFPGFRQFFAVKALPNPAILKLLLDQGCGLDCSSAAELYIARKLGVAGKDVMYTSNYTSKEDLLVAVKQGVIINLDDLSLVDDLADVCGEAGLPFPSLLSFRLNPGLGRTDSETASNVLGGPSAKFGVPRDAIVAAYRKAVEHGATSFGMHMMTGSCVMSDDYWMDTVGVLLETVKEVSDAVGISEWEFINIGGGLGIPYLPDAPPLDLTRLGRRLRKEMDRKAAELGLEATPSLMMENGRFVTGPFGWLVARCHVVKRAFGQTYLGLDACMSNLMRPGMYGSFHLVSVPAREGGGPTAKFNVVGTLCENNDWFAKDRELPAESGVGDLVVIHDTGAHAHSMGFQYNGKLRAPELMLLGGTTHLIRHREDIPGLFRGTVMPAPLGPQPDYDGCSWGWGAAAVAAAAAAACAWWWHRA
jgi:diaminopimelate decarboxylase